MARGRHQGLVFGRKLWTPLFLIASGACPCPVFCRLAPGLRAPEVLQIHRYKLLEIKSLKGMYQKMPGIFSAFFSESARLCVALDGRSTGGAPVRYQQWSTARISRWG
jgi:hypothetical protein